MTHVISVGSDPSVVLDHAPLDDVQPVRVGPVGHAGLVTEVVRQQSPGQPFGQGVQLLGGGEPILKGSDIREKERI